jgi:hypothetical protein
MPHKPKPPTKSLDPSGISATAAAAFGKTFPEGFVEKKALLEVFRRVERIELRNILEKLFAYEVETMLQIDQSSDYVLHQDQITDLKKKQR